MSASAAVLSLVALALLVAASIGGILARRRSVHLWIGESLRRVSGRALRLPFRPNAPSARHERRDEEGASPQAAPLHHSATPHSALRTPHSPTHLFLAVCDHFEPAWGGADRGVALKRVRRWVREYPQLFAGCGDSSGRPPQHTFFFPQEEYDPRCLDELAVLCGAGFGDVEIHLHHDGDTPDGLREKLETFRDALHDRHGLLRRDPLTDQVTYGFIHGNWALCNSRPDGRWCGVDEEITVLRETGCYADFTLPSAPSATQTRTINSIYYAFQKDGPKSHDRGLGARVGQRPPDGGLLMIQGPLVLDWRRRKWGVVPRIENGSLHAALPPDEHRLGLWLRANVQVSVRPEWVFVKLHTHGCKPGNMEMLLGERMRSFHAALARWAERHPHVKCHYVTAWEMARLVHQAEAGATQPVIESRVLV
ncbi:MAG: hypothetical protein ACREJB_05710 [Planctomycetaceae bacterium]